MFLISDWINRKWILVQAQKSKLGFGFKTKQTKSPNSNFISYPERSCYCGRPFCVDGEHTCKDRGDPRAAVYVKCEVALCVHVLCPDSGKHLHRLTSSSLSDTLVGLKHLQQD